MRNAIRNAAIRAWLAGWLSGLSLLRLLALLDGGSRCARR